MKPRLYIAAPLFSDAERAFNLSLKNSLAGTFDVFLPQEDGHLLNELLRNGLSPEQASKQIFDADVAAVLESDILLIVLDGRTVDEGACFELGVAYQAGKMCYGLQTDPRRLLPTGNNPMIEQSLVKIFGSVAELGTLSKDL